MQTVANRWNCRTIRSRGSLENLLPRACWSKFSLSAINYIYIYIISFYEENIVIVKTNIIINYVLQSFTHVLDAWLIMKVLSQLLRFSARGFAFVRDQRAGRTWCIFDFVAKLCVHVVSTHAAGKLGSLWYEIYQCHEYTDAEKRRVTL